VSGIATGARVQARAGQRDERQVGEAVVGSPARGVGDLRGRSVFGGQLREGLDERLPKCTWHGVVGGQRTHRISPSSG
jgi:hypothetical protein